MDEYKVWTKGIYSVGGCVIKSHTQKPSLWERIKQFVRLSKKSDIVVIDEVRFDSVGVSPGGE